MGMLILIIWVTISVIVGNYGDKRNIGFFWAFSSSMLFSPIIAMLFVLASKETPDKQPIPGKVWIVICFTLSLFFLIGIIVEIIKYYSLIN